MMLGQQMIKTYLLEDLWQNTLVILVLIIIQYKVVIMKLGQQMYMLCTLSKLRNPNTIWLKS